MTRLSAVLMLALAVLLLPDSARSQPCDLQLERCMSHPTECGKARCLGRLGMRQCGSVDVHRLRDQTWRSCQATTKDGTVSGARRPEIRYKDPKRASEDIEKAFGLFRDLSVVMGGVMAMLLVWGVAATQKVAMAKAWPWILAGGAIGALVAKLGPDATQVPEAFLEWFRNKIP